MIKVYAITLTICVVGLLVVISGAALSDDTSDKVIDPGKRIGRRSKMMLGAGTGFAMGGMAAEFSPLDLSWQFALLIALGGLIIGGLWTRYAVNLAGD